MTDSFLDNNIENVYDLLLKIDKEMQMKQQIRSPLIFRQTMNTQKNIEVIKLKRSIVKVF